MIKRLLQIIIALAVAVSTIIVTNSIAVAQDDSALKMRAEKLIAQIQTLDVEVEQRQLADPWVSPLKELVELGSNSTLPICKALSKTDNSFQISLFSFALRAIGDPRAVPTLIEAIPRGATAPRVSHGNRLGDIDLLRFMHANDISENDQPDRFYLAGPVSEILETLKQFADSNQGYSEREIGIQVGGPLQRYLKLKRAHENAEQWKSWWELRWRQSGVSEEFSQVDLAEFTLEPPTPVNSFLSKDAVVTMEIMNIVVEPFQNAERCCVQDLDTVRRAIVGDDFQGNNEDIDEVSDWANENGYDIIGTKVRIDGFDEPQYVIKPIGLEFWEIDASRYDTIQNEIGDADFDFGRPAKDYLMHFDEESQSFDPNQKTAFLFKTKDGTCGVILVLSQITELLDRDVSMPVFDIPDHQHYRFGVKIKLKLICEPNDKPAGD